jgi:23S rRNA (cytidine1920-2'-O)/16S rRNA (cytidine1409-2'-O)-methyltransferase
MRTDPRVIVLEQQNARLLKELPEKVDLSTIDASFISLRLLFPVVLRWLKPGGVMIALIKPQFEAGRGQVGKGGVVRETAIHRRVLEEVLAAAESDGLGAAGLIPSPLKGPAGNIEFLAYLKPGSHLGETRNLIDAALAEGG